MSVFRLAKRNMPTRLSLARSVDDLMRAFALKYMRMKVASSAQTNVYSPCAGSAVSVNSANNIRNISSAYTTS
jgi:hypothetical protein